MEDLEERLTALERAVTDGDHDLSALAESGDHAERIRELETQIRTLEDDVAELDAATQALRGYVGNLRAVNRDVERRADAALAATENLTSEGTGQQSAVRCSEDAIRNEPAAETPRADGGGERTPDNHGPAPAKNTVTSERFQQATAKPGRDTSGSIANSDVTASRTGSNSRGSGGLDRDEKQPATGSRTIGSAESDAHGVLDGLFEDDVAQEDKSTGPFERIRKLL